MSDLTSRMHQAFMSEIRNALINCGGVYCDLNMENVLRVVLDDIREWGERNARVYSIDAGDSFIANIDAYAKERSGE